MARRRQRGSVAVMAVIVIPALLVIGFGVIALGQVLIARQRLQYAADAVAMHGALMAKRQGLNVSAPNTAENYGWLPSMAQTQATLTTVRDGNLRMQGELVWPGWTFETQAGTEWARSQVTLSTTRLGFNLSATAATRIRQLRTASVRRRPPTLMLVLDYSGSMKTNSPQFGVAITQLRDVVGRFLDGLPQDDLRVGAVTFGGGVYDVVSPATRRDSSNFADIRRVLGKPPSGDTATGPAIRAALEQILAQRENFGRNILLVSDGAPFGTPDAEQIALGEAANARAASVQLLTVEVHHVESTEHMHDVLLQMSGSAGLHFEAENTAALNDLFQGVRARALCDVDIGDSLDAFAYLRNEQTRTEEALRPYGRAEDMSCPLACDVYGYRIEAPHVILSPIACDEILAGRRSVVVRWGATRMAM